MRECGNKCVISKNFTLVGGKNITIGKCVLFSKNITLSAWDNFHGQTFQPNILIGDNCSFGEGAHITSINSIEIGNGVLMGKNVTITDNSHGYCSKDEAEIPPIRRTLFSKGAVIIGDNVWIGDKVTVLPNVSIGEGCIIGANSVVTKDLPANSICAGNPCKIIKKL